MQILGPASQIRTSGGGPTNPGHSPCGPDADITGLIRAVFWAWQTQKSDGDRSRPLCCYCCCHYCYCLCGPPPVWGGSGVWLFVHKGPFASVMCLRISWASSEAQVYPGLSPALWSSWQGVQSLSFWKLCCHGITFPPWFFLPVALKAGRFFFFFTMSRVFPFNSQVITCILS